MENRTNLPLSAQQQNAWASAVNPTPVQASAQHALAIMEKFISESRVAMRDEVAIIYFPHMELLDEMHPTTRTKEGDMEYQTANDVEEEKRMRILLRFINGRLYNHLGQLDTFAHSWKQYQKNMRKAKPFGLRSKKAKANLQAILDTMLVDSEKERLVQTLRLFAVNLSLCYTAPDWRQVVEVTQEMYDAGLTSIINDWENEKSGWTATKLNVGDFLVLTKDGMYCIRRDEFFETHSTFVL